MGLLIEWSIMVVILEEGFGWEEVVGDVVEGGCGLEGEVVRGWV